MKQNLAILSFLEIYQIFCTSLGILFSRLFYPMIKLGMCGHLAEIHTAVEIRFRGLDASYL